MDASEAIFYLEPLAQGNNPISGTPLPADSPLHNSQVIRALFTAVRLLEANSSYSTDEGSRGGKPANAGQPWSKTEDRQLREEHKAGKTIHEMAQEHKRSRGAIRSRLVRLGLIQGEFSTAEAGSDSSSEEDEQQKWWKKDRSQAGKTWTEEEDIRLKELTLAGTTLEEIARLLGRGTFSVEVRQCKLKLVDEVSQDDASDPLPF